MTPVLVWVLIALLDSRGGTNWQPAVVVVDNLATEADCQRIARVLATRPDGSGTAIRTPTDKLVCVQVSKVR